MERIIPKRNYVIVVLLIILVFTASYAFANLYNIYQDGKIKTSPLSNKQVLYDDLKNATVDIDADTFLVVSYLGSRNVFNNEKQILKVLTKYNLTDNVMYLNITDELEEPDFKDELNKTLKLENKISKFPAVVFYRDNEPIEVIDSSEHMLNKDDFENIIEKYELAG